MIDSATALEIAKVYNLAEPKWRELGKTLAEIAKKMHRVEYDNSARFHSKSMWTFKEEEYSAHNVLEDGTVNVEMTSWAYGEEERNEYQFHISRLDEDPTIWMPAYDKEITDRREARMKKDAEEREEREKNAAIASKEARRQKWLELSKEFGS